MSFKFILFGLGILTTIILTVAAGVCYLLSFWGRVRPELRPKLVLWGNRLTVAAACLVLSAFFIPTRHS